MILKEKDATPNGNGRGGDERAFYGHKQEQDVAFQLRREFGEHKQIHVINDLRIEHRGERAQIDHLILHPYGFIIVESKSIAGEVTVNAAGEWSRSYQGNWMGIPSPIRQAELQLDLLKALLSDNVEHFLGKLLGVQTQVAHREWRTLCAISSTAILHRDKMPKDVASRVVKTEFVASKVKELVGSLKIGFLKGRAGFFVGELDNIANFLLEHTTQVGTATADGDSAPATPEPAASVAEPVPNYSVTPAPTTSSSPTEPPAQVQGLMTCKQCGEASGLTGMYGQYGYYVKCGHCSTNTSMKQSCPACGWKSVRVSKDGPDYTGTCRKCTHQFLVFRQE
ncbi:MULTISPECIES: NERD domain-containing protein [unclassified Halomonas]|uniref:NERD domain-containing protein n=1 Tax=unclassified Halomonas TaxID=2609666 RepID=UPI002885364F|nr:MULTISPECIES: NERD domain-containing protein [unclassified Halomonas]MDT0500794.1 NERD domain-containing protein [Halomonas sp. PAR7]MDT0513016.1 NERD domain-containing protein [Halomonas sp. LES1]MDT0591573.1 NERD domain-containing protein [Halomonas sp. PAR8]